MSTHQYFEPLSSDSAPRKPVEGTSAQELRSIRISKRPLAHGTSDTLPSYSGEFIKGKNISMAKTKEDAITMLKADHRKVEDLFEKYEKSRGKKSEIARKICMELIIHSMLEEEIFYPACQEVGVDEDMLDEANVEHDGAKVLIAELIAGSPDDDFYDAKVKVLSEEIKHHVKEE